MRKVEFCCILFFFLFDSPCLFHTFIQNQDFLLKIFEKISMNPGPSRSALCFRLFSFCSFHSSLCLSHTFCIFFISLLLSYLKEQKVYLSVSVIIMNYHYLKNEVLKNHYVVLMDPFYTIDVSKLKVAKGQVTFLNFGSVTPFTGLPQSWKNHGISGILKFSGISGKVMEILLRLWRVMQKSWNFEMRAKK